MKLAGCVTTGLLPLLCSLGGPPDYCAPQRLQLLLAWRLRVPRKLILRIVLTALAELKLICVRSILQCFHGLLWDLACCEAKKP